ncbi:MAG: hypothetical protein ACYC5G_05330 [Candidatus Doudnabacteria bacterium]
MDQKIVREEILYTAIFGALWGVMEVVIGTTLQTTRLPFRGIIMAVMAAIILVTAREFVWYKSSSIVIGAIAAVLKMFSMSGLVITPIAAIMMESFLAEAVFLIFSYNIFSSAVAGALILIYSFSHGLIMHGVFFGSHIYRTYINIISEFASWINVNKENLYLFLIGIGLINVLIGMLAGIIGWKIGKRTRQILREGEG